MIDLLWFLLRVAIIVFFTSAILHLFPIAFLDVTLWVKFIATYIIVAAITWAFNNGGFKIIHTNR